MNCNDTANTASTVLLTARDYSRLERLLNAAETSETARSLLRLKLAASRIVFGSDMPDDIVTIGSRIRISLTGQDAGEIIVGHDERLPPASGIATLELAWPRAIALIGCRAGSTIVAPREDGFAESITIVSVLAQPEAAAATGRVVAFPTRRPPRPPADEPDDPGPSAA